MTPEGKVKTKIKLLLDDYHGSVYYYMPVPGGYGRPTLDYLGSANGWFFAIEAKAPGKSPTARQQGTIEEIAEAGGRVFKIDGDAALAVFSDWLWEVTRRG